MTLYKWVTRFYIYKSENLASPFLYVMKSFGHPISFLGWITHECSDLTDVCDAYLLENLDLIEVLPCWDSLSLTIHDRDRCMGSADSYSCWIWPVVYISPTELSLDAKKPSFSAKWPKYILVIFEYLAPYSGLWPNVEQRLNSCSSKANFILGRIIILGRTSTFSTKLLNSTLLTIFMDY